MASSVRWGECHGNQQTLAHVSEQKLESQLALSE